MAPLPHPVSGTVAVPGSKSLTARLLVVAALADGTSTLHGAAEGDDAERMVDGLRRLGVPVHVGDGGRRLTVGPPAVGTPALGASGTVPPSTASAPPTVADEPRGTTVAPTPAPITLDVGLAGTVARFLTPVAAAGTRPVTVDGTPRMRQRPMADLVDALRRLGAHVVEHGRPGHLPITVRGPLRGGAVAVRGDASSQFLSGLLLAAPLMPDGVRVEVTTPLVSRPYVAMTVAVMDRFGVRVAVDGDRRFTVAPGQRYRATDIAVEPDASAASYVYAAAAVTGSALGVRGLDRSSLQGDVGFVDVLGAMGAAVSDGPHGLVVTGGRPLRGVTVDMADRSDVVQSLAVVAPFATSPTEVHGIGFIRGKETDRIGHTVAQLRRCGIAAEERPDGLVVLPSAPHGATIDPGGDHRMAMSFAVLGLRVPGMAIADPAVVDKTFPAFFDLLEEITRLPARPPGHPT